MCKIPLMLKLKRVTKNEFVSAMVMLAESDPASYQAVRSRAWEIAMGGPSSPQTN